MALKKRWRLGSYQLQYNPKTNETNMKTTASEEISVNGIVTNQNKFFDEEMNFTIDLYDKPTYFSEIALVTFTNNFYIGITEKRFTGQLYCLKPSGVVDVMEKSSGLVTSSFTISGGTGTPIALTHMDDRIAIIFIDGSTGYLNINDEFGALISKYTITDADYLSASSLAWDYNSKLYMLSKYGKILTCDPTNGSTLLIYQSDDFTSNKSLNISAYKGIHFLNGYVGFIINNSITYLDKNLVRIYSTDIPSNKLVKSGISTLSHGYASGDFYILSHTAIVKIIPNTCGIDITIIKSQVANGMVPITDEKNAVFYIIIKSIGVNRKRNKQDARYELRFSGKIVR